MKKKLFILSLLMLLNLGLMAQDSDNMLNIVRGKQVKANLNGKGGVKFIANKPDYIIRTTFKDDAVCDKARKVGEHYEYELLLDISKGKNRVFVVSKNGSPVSGKSDQLNINADEYRFFSIEEPGTLIAITTQRIDSKTYFAKGENPVEALIEIKSAVQLSEITTSELVKISQTGGTKGKDGTYNYSIVINAKQLPLLKEKVQKANDLYRAKDESASSSWTDEQWKELDLLRESRDNASNDYANAVTISLQGKNTNRVLLRSDLIEKLTPKDKLVCNIDLLSQTDTVIHEQTYQEALAIARERYKNYPLHTESSYYDAARLAYDKAIEHNDCPQDMRESIRVERDTMASLRRNTYLIEAAEAKANEYENKKGFECDEVYKYLSGELRFANRILQSHPEITGIMNIKERVLARLRSHPKGQNVVETTVTKQRETISGTISFKNEYMAIPFQNMRVFATTSSKIKDGQSRKIANVKTDGTYNAVKPDGMDPLYIYVTGEKDDAHYVPKGTTTMDIIVK